MSFYGGRLAFLFEYIVLLTSIVFCRFAIDEFACFYVFLGMLCLLNIVIGL